ncbi:hypothetical protein SLS64_013560 [Diaporthe eres]|uniref:Uncharacterized protein n=1 Tax=Diaporthe eres TaxID=83184 RepID=A0ABR1P7W4_DIAER
MLLSTSNAGDLSNAGQPARLATSRRGGIRPGGRSFRPSNASSLADLANKNTISKDNTTGDEEREARLLANMGKKICNTSQQAKRFEASHGEWRKRRRRAPKGLNEALDKDLTQPDANQLDKLDQSLSSIKATARPAEVDPFDFWDATKKHKPKRGEIPEAESLR